MSELDTDRFRRTFVVWLVIAISAVFLAMITPFIKPLFLAAVFSGIMTPLYRRLAVWFRGRKKLASVATIILLLLVVIGPLSGFVTLIATQAIEISNEAIPWVKQQIDPANPNRLDFGQQLADKLPFAREMLPEQGDILEKFGGVIQALGKFVVNNVSKLTAGAAGFFLSLFVMLYAMYFFLIDGRKIVDRILYLTPLGPVEEGHMLDRFTSITRATIKGTLVIGLVQGTLGGLGFYFAGLQGAAFWGTVMAVLSIIPALGTAIVWVPGVIFLLATGHVTSGIVLAIYCAAIVGTADNILRPILVGKDTEMPDLLVLIGTLGGIFLFGVVGIIVGPVICGLFLTIWDIYGQTFKQALPATDKSWQYKIPARKKKSKPKQPEDQPAEATGDDE
ncbi:MAG: AI-2E family transporter [Verrucomicrobiales bacterium]